MAITVEFPAKVGVAAVDENTNTAVVTTFPDPVAAPVRLTSGVRSKWFKTSGMQKTTVWFCGTGSDGATINYQVYVHHRFKRNNAEAYLPKKIGSGAAKLSTYTAAVAGIGTITDLMADTIADDSSLGKLLVTSPENNTPAYIEFDNEGADYVEVMTDLGTGTITTASALVQLGPLSPFALRRLLGSYSGDGGAASDDSVKAAMDIVDTNVDTLTTNLALVSGYTQYDGWRVLRSASILANPGVGGTNFFTVTGSVELQVWGESIAQITGTGAETLTVQSADTTEIIAATTATDFASAGLLWVDNAGMATVPLESRMPKYLFSAKAGNTTIKLLQSGATAWTAGALYLYCRWRPLSSTGAVAQS